MRLSRSLLEAARKDGNEQRFYDDVQEGIDKGEIGLKDFSIKELFVEFVEDGRSFVDNWDRHKEARESLIESGVSSTAFMHITGQLLVNEVQQAYQDPAFIGDQLCTVTTTRLPRGEKIPGLAEIGNEAEAVGEGKPYPMVGFGEDWIETPETIKRGMIIGLTREIIVADLTGRLIENAQRIAHWIAYNRELRILQTALGITSSYNRKGRGVVATYGDNSGNHDWDNLAASNTLTGWESIQTAELLFDGMTDPNTGTPIVVTPNTMVVPSALKHTARRIINATEIRYNDGASNTTATYSANPVAGSYNILSSPLVYTTTSSASTWFLGDFKGAFRYMEVSPITTVQAPTNSEMEFTNDVVMRWKVSEWGAAAVYEPRKVVKCT